MKTIVFQHDEDDDPYEQGFTLGMSLLYYHDLQSLVVDMTNTPAWVLSRLFFYGFLKSFKVYNRPAIESARKVTWVLKYDFQVDKVNMWMHDIDVFGRVFPSVGKRPNTEERKKKIASKKKRQNGKSTSS